MSNNSIKTFTNAYDDYLRDESRKVGWAESISFPTNEIETAQIISFCNAKKLPITVQGSRTGVGASAVPFGGHIINFKNMNRMKMVADSEGRYLICQPGITLKEINDYITKETKDEYFFPPDPTELTASIGGMVSCNSSGARTYFYGSVRNYINSIYVILADGRSLEIKRGSYYANGYSFSIPFSQKSIKGIIPSYIMPSAKNSAGYYSNKNMDLIDLFIGSEGTLGVITEIKLKLIKKPKRIWGAIIFFCLENQGINFSVKIRDRQDLKSSIISVEFFDTGSISLLREERNNNEAISESPFIDNKFSEAVFLEFKGENDNEMIEALASISQVIIEAGGDSINTWVADNISAFERFKKLRHATPECLNQRIDEIRKTVPEITKLGSDMSVTDEKIIAVVNMYRADLIKAGLKHVIFGHIGNNHLHVNILSRDLKDYIKGKELFNRWAETVSSWKGSVSAEHGIGKLKKEYLLKMYGKENIDMMRKLKKEFDPNGILGRDNIFDWQK